MLTPSLVSDSFAGTENPGRDQGEKLAKGCDKGKQPKNNPNCVSSDYEGFTTCDTAPPFGISTDEFNANGNAIATGTIVSVENDLPEPDSNHDGLINTQAELDAINALVAFPCLWPDV